LDGCHPCSYGWKGIWFWQLPENAVYPDLMARMLCLVNKCEGCNVFCHSWLWLAKINVEFVFFHLGPSCMIHRVMYIRALLARSSLTVLQIFQSNIFNFFSKTTDAAGVI
jgi:hypothetical protein